MPRSLDFRRILVKAARLYYEEGLNQAEVADRLRLSRQKVQRILSEAQKQGVVKITIKPIVGIFSDLESELEERFGLAEAIVVETTTTAAFDNQPTIAREVGAGAAEYLLRVLRPRDKIVISVGNALLGMVSALPFPAHIDADDLTVIQGMGGLGDPSHETYATQLVSRAAQALGSRSVLLGAPAVAGTRNARDTFLRDPNVARTLQLARAADMCFVGIGSCDADAVAVTEFWKVMTPATLKELKERGARGSINLRYFDENGTTIPSSFDKRVVGLTLDEIKKIRRVIGVAGGSSKHHAIRAALEGKIINVLVTDHVSAQFLLRK